MTETNFDDFAFSHIFVFVSLSDLLLFTSVNLEMVVGYNDFLVPIIDLFLLHFSFLFDHIITRNKHSIEIRSLRESSSLSFDLGLEVRLSILPRHILEPFKLHFSFPSLLVVRDQQIRYFSLIRSLWMFIPVLTLHNVIKSSLSFPSSLIVLLSFLSHLIFVH